MTDEGSRTALIEHFAQTWPSRPMEVFSWELGPINETLPGFRVLRIEPLEDESWVYASLGAFAATEHDRHGHEFLLFSPIEEPLHVELLALAALEHARPESRLHVGHTVPIGHPWLADSASDHLLASKPYPIAEEKAQLTLPSGVAVNLLWLVPVTASEVSFRHECGLEALEQRLEDSGASMSDSLRPPVA